VTLGGVVFSLMAEDEISLAMAGDVVSRPTPGHLLEDGARLTAGGEVFPQLRVIILADAVSPRMVGGEATTPMTAIRVDVVWG
jgi:hypothetical protein